MFTVDALLKHHTPRLAALPHGKFQKPAEPFRKAA